jgi:hypothetical protein
VVQSIQFVLWSSGVDSPFSLVCSYIVDLKSLVPYCGSSLNLIQVDLHQKYENILNNYEDIVFVQCFFKHCCQRDHATKQNHLHKNSSCAKKNNV